MGLNDSVIAHAETPLERICRIFALEPTYFLLPDELMGGLAPAFSYEIIREFHDPAFAQSKRAVPRSAWLCEIRGNRPDIERQCP